MCARAGRPADEDPALWIDSDVGLTVGMDWIDHQRYLEGDTWRGLRRQTRCGCGERKDHGGCGDQRESRTDHPMPPCPQQRAELVTPSVAHKVEASNRERRPWTGSSRPR